METAESWLETEQPAQRSAALATNAAIRRETVPVMSNPGSNRSPSGSAVR
jgi:hypothetical protein